ncbi:long-chain fatty acid-CoA ligase [Saitozyma podzolica]|uniref:Long-chain fatty acid-CoA ligase n=1 Tax=Saitozyma podzolica TaxID=1890683 RepID=A0A427YMC4_9TREE|nr:long-chain fatty acid-CoA ligase [Saitozyma podzolica]
MWKRQLANVPLPSDPTIRRSFLSPDELLTRPAGDEVLVVGDIFPYCARRYGDKVACSYRDVVDVVEERKVVKDSDGMEEEKVWKYFTLSDPIPVTFNTLASTVSHLTSSLLHLGFTDPALPIPSRPRVSIYADTSLRWQLMAQSFARLGHTITTAYTTLGEEGLLRSWQEPDVRMCFCGEGQVGMVAEVLDRAEKVRWIVYDGEERADKVSGSSQVSAWLCELLELGKSNPTKPEDLGPKPTEDDVFCIMYTSGSTGPPKGVILTNRNIISSLAGSTKLWGSLFDPKNDLLLAFLPLSHILEQFLEYTFYLVGVPLGYATVKTLLDDSVRGCKGDFAVYKPTLIAGVPAIYEMIRKGIVKKIHEAGPVVGTIFSLAVKGKQTLPWPISAVIDTVLFARVKAATGGRLRTAVTGGGAISKETQLFLSTVLAPMMQGYGLTETCGMTAITRPESWLPGSVGVLGPSTECKLQDVPDLGYINANKLPQGEIWLRGPNVFKGYLGMEELTRESFTEDGWFKTGDIGQWEPNGTLTIIDRIKHLVKLQNGEYIALDKVESVYKATDVVMMLCIAAPPSADRPIAIIYPHEGNLRNHLKAAGLPDDGTPAEWASDEKVKKYILGQMLQTAKKGGLGKMEMIRDVIVTKEEWSPDNGLLTPAMKLARPAISKAYEKEIKAS